MRLLALEGDLVHLAASWLGEERNYRWLDFGGGVQQVGATALKVMAQKPSHCIRLFTGEDAETPIGLVAFSHIAAAFRTANLWYVLGDQRQGGRGHTRRAVARLLTLGFGALGLGSASAWVVEGNTPSMHVLLRNGFRSAGRLRACHVIGGRARDRLLFDLLASEHVALAGSVGVGEPAAARRGAAVAVDW